MHSLPIFVKLAGRAVILVGQGEAADAKRRLLERAGAVVVGQDSAAALAIVVNDDAAAARLRARGVLVNATDRPDLCDFTLPAIVDRDPVIVAIGTGGASAGLAKALRQRIETLLPQRIGALATDLFASRSVIRARWPDAGERRRAIDAALMGGGVLDPLRDDSLAIDAWIEGAEDKAGGKLVKIRLGSADPDDLTLRTARLLGQADRIYHDVAVPAAILDRARADASRIMADRPPDRPDDGLSLWIAI